MFESLQNSIKILEECVHRTWMPLLPATVIEQKPKKIFSANQKAKISEKKSNV